MIYERKTVDILISNDFRTLLESIQSESTVAKLLLKKRHQKSDLVENPVNYISISSDDKNKISYLSKDRVDNLTAEGMSLEDLWITSKRYHVKPGSFISKIFKDIPNKEVEKFSSLFKSESNKINFRFDIVSGLDIKSYYHHESYKSLSGTLGSSCMKHEFCQEFLNIYTENKENISMLVMLDDENLLIGRALLWNFDSYKIMDRIYTINDEFLQWHFKKWATKNGYLYKSEQNWYNTLFFENLNTFKKEIFLKIDLKTNNLSRYPYMDTFKFIDKKNTLYNYLPSNVEVKILCATDGSLYEQDYLRFDFIDRIFRYRGECVYLDYIGSFTHEKNTKWSDINNQYILNSHSFYDTEIADYIFVSEMDNLNNKDRILKARGLESKDLLPF
jgi:hypothetical protein